MDNLILLAKGGIVYWGPAKDAVKYFAKLGYQCPEYTNPPDYFSECHDGDDGEGQMTMLMVL